MKQEYLFKNKDNYEEINNYKLDDLISMKLYDLNETCWCASFTTKGNGEKDAKNSF